MKQHNASTDRDYWKNARDRNRMQARYYLRQRVISANPCDDEVLDFDASLVSTILENIVDGNRSYFSTVFIERNIVLLESPIPISYLNRQDGTFRGLYRLVSQLGQSGVQELRDYLKSIESFSFMEYAIWFRRFHIVGGLLVSGVSPTLGLDATLRQRLRMRFMNNVPRALQIYIVQQAVVMRQSFWRLGVVSSAPCNLCTTKASTIRFRCDHLTCAPCFWSDLIENMEQRSGHVVQCPICDKGSLELESLADTRTPCERFEESLEKYLQLPDNAKDLRNLKEKKKKLSENQAVCATWAQAAIPSCGRSKEVRRDKWFLYGEKGAYHYIKACLDLGIDGNMSNEYGQTILYIAALKGYLRLVHLLVSFGCNPLLQSNDGSSAIDTACFNQHDTILSCFSQAGYQIPDQISTRPSLLVTNGGQFTILIPFTSEHVGAGSFYIDEFLSDESIDRVARLWQDLPSEIGKKKNPHIPCSTRSYFCDSTGWIATALTNVLRGQGQWDTDELFVWPHMRFLSYEQPGAVLAPHVDLCRAHPHETTKRSTHSFLLYLTDCDEGGDTVLLESLTSNAILARVRPTKGRLLVFPHDCPHRGDEVLSVPKLLIRGEVFLSQPRR